MAPGIIVRDENRDAYMALKVEIPPGCLYWLLFWLFAHVTFPDRQKGEVVQIRVVSCPQAVAVGVMLIDGQELVDVHKGKAVQVSFPSQSKKYHFIDVPVLIRQRYGIEVHVRHTTSQIVQLYGDHLWEMGSKTMVDFKQSDCMEDVLLTEQKGQEDQETAGDSGEGDEEHVDGGEGQTQMVSRSIEGT